MKNLFLLLLTINLLSCTSNSKEAQKFYLSPAGNDADAGSLEAPIATLTKAKQLIKKYDGLDITFYLKGGKYVLDSTLVINRSDWKSSEHSVQFLAFEDEKPIICSDIPVINWERADALLEGLPEKAKGKIWSANIPDGITKFNVLYKGDQMLKRARSQGYTPKISGKGNVAEEGEKNTIHYPEGSIKNWKNITDVELAIVPSRPWIMNLLPLKSVDEEKLTAQTGVPGTYRLEEPSFGYFPQGSFWIENVLEALDEPGEWVINTEERKIYLWPTDSVPMDIVAPGLVEYIRLEGEIAYEDSKDIPVQNITFRGIAFLRGDRYDWQADKTGLGLQHDWEMFDSPTAMLRLRGTENCVIDNCRFYNSGGAAIRLDLHCQQNQIINSTIEDIGGVGILLAGYGPGTKDVNHSNTIVNNNISNVGQLLWHSAGIFAWQSGQNLIQNNLVHHVPYIGIVVSGRTIFDRQGRGEAFRTIRWNEINSLVTDRDSLKDWYVREPFMHGRQNVIDKNEIHHTMQILGDGNCIYISGTGKDNIVSNNYLHDNVSPSINANIRCDDDQHETTIENNVIANSCGEGFIFKGKNTIRNNIVYNLMDKTPEGIECIHQRGYLVLPYDPVTGSTVTQNIFYSKVPNQRILTEGCKKETCATLNTTQTDYNLYYNEADQDWAESYLNEKRQHGIEINSQIGDPMFVDAEKSNFELKPSSPALKMGFTNIDLTEVGLFKDRKYEK